MKILFFVLCLAMTFGCSKFSADQKYVGDYEWVCSSKGVGSTHSFDSEGVAYGIRISKKGKVFFFKNGKKADVVSDQHSFGLMGDTLITYTFPYEGYMNQFAPIK